MGWMLHSYVAFGVFFCIPVIMYLFVVIPHSFWEKIGLIISTSISVVFAIYVLMHIL